MLLSSLFYLTYIISAAKVNPDWGLALSNLVYPHGVEFTPQYIRNYFFIGMGVHRHHHHTLGAILHQQFLH